MSTRIKNDPQKCLLKTLEEQQFCAVSQTNFKMEKIMH